MPENTSPKAITKRLSEVEAFTAYLTLGSERTLVRVHQQFPDSSPSLRTLKEWSRKYGWVGKAEEYDHEQHEQAYKIALKETAKFKIDILSVCKAILATFAEDIIGEKIITKTKGGKEKIMLRRYKPNMADIERAYKIVKQELGEGLPEWEKLKEINLIAVFQQIFKAEEEAKRKRDGDIKT